MDIQASYSQQKLYIIVTLNMTRNIKYVFYKPEEFAMWAVRWSIFFIAHHSHIHFITHNNSDEKAQPDLVSCKITQLFMRLSEFSVTIIICGVAKCLAHFN